MIFQYHTLEKVLAGTKTQSRRLIKPDETLVSVENPFGGYKPLYVRNNRNYSRLYTIGQTYLVQRKSGQNEGAVRIRIDNITRQDVRQITDQDAIAEGYRSAYNFMCWWCAINDPIIVVGNQIVRIEWDTKLRRRPDKKYQAWVLSFHLVK